MEKAGLNITNNTSNNAISSPLWLLAELTYACPLQCVYCSNPVEFARYKTELTTAEWIKVLRDARDMGAAQLGFSGGEPLVRKDLEILIKEARDMGFFTNLITSTVGMNEKRLEKIKEAGLDSIQISIQSSEKKLNDYIAGTESFDHKILMAKEVKKLGYPLTFNFVIHRHNIHQIEDMLKLSVELEANYVELANTQYYGFALVNRNTLLPSKKQLVDAEKIAHEYQERYKDKMRIYFVVPDYYEDRPKPCMNGWGKVFLTITPDGYALPCHNARVLKDIEFPNVRNQPLRSIWEESFAFNRFRGEAWMTEPCRTCPERTKDFGGCHCQAFLLTGSPNNADPVCTLSPNRYIVDNAIAMAGKTGVEQQPLVFRNPKNSKKLSPE